MGSGHSIPYTRISRIIPQIHESAWEDIKWPDKQRDRDQFIYALISLMSDNGATSLDDHEFKLLFSRKQEDRVVATVVAIKEGRIQRKIESPLDGENQHEAFKLLKKHVEMNLHDLLTAVPDVAAAAGSSRSVGGWVAGAGAGVGVDASRRSSLTTLRTTDLPPPAYGSSDAGGDAHAAQAPK